MTCFLESSFACLTKISCLNVIITSSEAILIGLASLNKACVDGLLICLTRACHIPAKSLVSAGATTGADSAFFCSCTGCACGIGLTSCACGFGTDIAGCGRFS